MMRKTQTIMLMVAALCVSAMAATVIDTVYVPVKVLKLESITTVNGNQVYAYSGKVIYGLTINENDSMNIALDFVPVGGAGSIAPTQLTGDAGIKTVVNGENGEKCIRFKCTITGTPAAQYTARITINADKSALEKKVAAKVALMTLAQKVQITAMNSALKLETDPIPALGIPGLKSSDGPHGVRDWGNATLFPTLCAQACSWDTGLVHRIGIALGQEFRGKGRFCGLGPMMNMIRDPRGGRDFETYSEDAYLASRLAVASVLGLQSVGTIATPKHMVCNEREDSRMNYNVVVSERALRELYLPPFVAAVTEGKCWSLMAALNKVNGSYNTEYRHVETDIIKNECGFRGFIMSDWNGVHSSNAATQGCDMEMPGAVYFGANLGNAASGVSTATINDMATRIIRSFYWANVMDGATITQYASSINSAEHQALTKEAARKVLVLAKNNGTLPLSKTQSVAVVGFTVYDGTGNASTLATRPGGGGSSYVIPFYSVSPQAGIQAKIGASLVTTDYTKANTAIVFAGVGGEKEDNDRASTSIDAGQNTLISTIKAAGKKVVVVFTGGSASVRGAWWDQADAVLIAFYPGQEQGTGIADVLFGDYNPSGRLSVSFPDGDNQLPAWTETNLTINYEDASEGRGYKYCDRHNLTPLLSFGYGLSYTTFSYANLRITPATACIDDDITVQADITNAGSVAGTETPQLYIKTGLSTRPVKELRGFAKVDLQPNETKTVTFNLTKKDLAYFNDTKSKWTVDPGVYTILVGSSSRDADLKLSSALTVTAN
jgi:beta-glucosidase